MRFSAPGGALGCHSAALWADGDCNECLYAVARRIPPSGQENPYSRHLKVPSALASTLHVKSVAQIDALLSSGLMATVVIPRGDARINSFGLPRRYLGRARMHGYDIFWDPMPRTADAQERRRQGRVSERRTEPRTVGNQRRE